MSKRVQIPTPFSKGQLDVLEKADKFRSGGSQMAIGIPKENTYQENRVALNPSSVNTLVNRGQRVLVQDGAGEKSNFSNHEYSEAGAEIVYSSEEVFKADIILKVAPPLLDEIEYFHPNQIIISPIHLPSLSPDLILRLKAKRVIALAMEYIKDESDTFPLVRTLSEMAGINAMLIAGDLLSSNKNGRGVLLGGISGVPPAKVVILGAGVAAEFATKVAIGLGAEVRVFDDNIYKLMRLQRNIGRQVFTSSLNPQVLEKELISAEVVIGAIHAESGRTPIIVSEETVGKMQFGSVIIDISIDQGGCFATSKMTSHDKPTFTKYDVIHYCVPNITSRIPRTASNAISNILRPLILKAEEVGGMEKMINQNLGLRHGVYSYKGCLTNQHMSDRFQIKYTNLELLLTTSW